MLSDVEYLEVMTRQRNVIAAKKAEQKTAVQAGQLLDCAGNGVGGECPGRY